MNIKCASRQEKKRINDYYIDRMWKMDKNGRWHRLETNRLTGEILGWRQTRWSKSPKRKDDVFYRLFACLKEISEAEYILRRL